MYQVYRLYFRSAHTELDSIKLSGAILDALITMYPSMTEEILNEAKQGSFAVSSAFPMRESDDVEFFPSPLLTYAYPSGMTRIEILKQSSKRKKEIKFAPIKNIEQLCTEYLTGGKPPLTLKAATEILSAGMSQGAEVIGDEGCIKDRSNCARDKDGTEIMGDEGFDEYGVHINDGGETDVYVRELGIRGHLHYRGDKGIASDPVWFIMQYSKGMFKHAMPFLSDRGLSGMISRGKGMFYHEEKECRFSPGFKGEGYYLLLSPLIPLESEMPNVDLEHSRYVIRVFSGRNRNGEGLGKYRYFGAGSLLYLRGDVKGKTISAAKDRILVFKTILIKVA